MTAINKLTGLQPPSVGGDASEAHAIRPNLQASTLAAEATLENDLGSAPSGEQEQSSRSSTSPDQAQVAPGNQDDLSTGPAMDEQPDREPSTVAPYQLGRPEIQVNDRQLRDLTDDCLAVLRAFNDPPYLFVRAGKLTCLHQQESGHYTIVEVTGRILRDRLTRVANFHKMSRDGCTECAPPMEVVHNILALPPVEWGLPPLQGIIEIPALREDGTIIIEAGYDERSGLFYGKPDRLSVPAIPDEPTPTDIRKALDTLEDALCDFPFADRASRTNAIAAMLTPVVRPAIKGPTPLALFDAPTPGTGKSLLSEVVSIIATGREPQMFSAPRGEEEWRKALTSILRAGPPVVTIDNVRYPLDNADLCKALTETTHGDRLLGKSEVVNLSARCSWIATGNNIQVGGDMRRRCYWIRLDARCSKPYQRTGFRHKGLKNYIRDHQGELLAALLTLARAWFAAGRPEPRLTPLGSFEDWTVTIGGTLERADIDDFLGNSKALYDPADAEGVQWEEFLKTLAGAFDDEPFTVAQLWERINEKNWNESSRRLLLTDGAEALRAALPEFIAQAMPREGFFKQRLGFAFSERIGRRYGDSQVRLERGAPDRHEKVARWKVVRNG